MPGVRARIMATVLLLSAISMIVIGLVNFVVQRDQVQDRVDASVKERVTQVPRVVTDAVRADKPLTTPLEVVKRTIWSYAPSSDEICIGLNNGRLQYLPSTATYRGEDVAPLIAAAAAMSRDGRTVLRDAQTPIGHVRYAVVQVSMPGSKDVASYIAGTITDGQEAVVMDNTKQYALMCLASLLALAAVGWVVAGRLLAPLRQLRAAAQTISSTDLSLRIPVSGRDDISDLTRTVNAMLARLQSAFETQQNFLDDAGHELRTPLTILRGHLEVLDGADSTEIAETRALLLDELDRMGRLVDDLIVLARTRRPDFVRLEVVELDRLLTGVFDKAQALGAREWRVDHHAGGTIVADPQRLTQALLQLSQNAATHTRQGDQIGIGAAREGGYVRLWVRDAGVGVAPEDRLRIFERFGRARTGRGHGGSGLGLSIVKAIATAHEGQVGVHDTEGGGATFWLLLPDRADQHPVRGTTRTEDGGVDLRVGAAAETAEAAVRQIQGVL